MKSSIAFIIAFAASVSVVEAGTDKTLAPTPGVTRSTEPPITPFPTEASTIETPAPVRYCCMYECCIVHDDLGRD
jgi:hypothetical protein